MCNTAMIEMVVKNLAYASEHIQWVLTTCVCLTWTSLLIAKSNFLSVPWAWLPPKKGTVTHSLSLLASSTTCFGTTSPRAPELPLAIHRTLSEEAVSCLTPLALTLQTPIRGPITLPSALHCSIWTGQGTGTPAGPLIPHAIHYRAKYIKL